MMSPRQQSNEYEGIPKVAGAATFEEEYRIVGLRQEGRDHAVKRIKPCQDSFGFGRSGHFLWMAVADGVGSETHSQFGAQIACASIAPFLYQLEGAASGEFGSDGFSDIGKAVLENARSELEKFAKHAGLDLRALSSTLQVVLVDLALDKVTYAAIGDGNCIMTGSDGETRIVGHNRPAPSAGTPSLGSSDCRQFMFSESIGAVCETDQIVLFSDGLDRMFVIPRTPDPYQAVGTDSVEYVSKTLTKASNEFQALNAIGKFFNVETYQDLIRDDLSLLAFKNLDLALMDMPEHSAAHSDALTQMVKKDTDDFFQPENDSLDPQDLDGHLQGSGGAKFYEGLAREKRAPQHANPRFEENTYSGSQSKRRPTPPQPIPMHKFERNANNRAIIWLIAIFSCGVFFGFIGAIAFSPPSYPGATDSPVDTFQLVEPAPDAAESLGALESAERQPNDNIITIQSENGPQ